MKNLIVYFYDQMIAVVYQGKVIQKKFASICDGMIINRELFMEDFLKLVKQEKIRSKLFGDQIDVVKDAYYRASDLYYMESIFSELGFIKVHFLDIYDLFDDTYTYVGVFKNSLIFYLDKPVIVDLNYFKDIPKFITYFKDYYKDSVILFGTHLFIPKIQCDSVNVYYVDDYQNYITKCLLKVKKYGV